MKNIELANQVTTYLDDHLMPFYTIVKPSSRLQFHEVIHVGDDYVVAEFYGGLNGLGDWNSYLLDIANLFYNIERDYHCWLVDLHNDCLDDVFYLKIGIKSK